MSWYKDLSASLAYPYRWPITVYNSGGSGNNDVTITLPPEWDEFWGVVQSTGYDIRFTRSDGTTAIAWKRTTWTYASHTAVLELDAVPLIATGVTVVWMYWGAGSSAADGATTPTISSAKTGQVSLHRPDRARIFRYRTASPGSQRPPDTIAKTANEKVMVWVDWSSAINPRVGSGNSRANYDEAGSTVLDVQTGAASQSAMFDQSEIVAVGANRPIFGYWVQAGTSGSNYVIIPKLTTAEGLVYEHRVRMQVYSTAE